MNGGKLTIRQSYLIPISYFLCLFVACRASTNSVHESHVSRVKTTGKALVLRCPFRKEDSISWMKDGQLFKRRHNDLPIRFRNGSTIIHLDDIKEEDAGNYTCVARNETGIFQKTFVISVIRQLAHPPIILRQIANRTAYLGDKVTFECPIKSDLQHNIRWVKMVEVNGSYVNDSGHAHVEELIHNGKTVNITNNRETLSLSNVTQDMSGWYVCLAENSIGKSYERAWLEIVQDKPISAGRTKSPALKDIYPLLAAVACLCLLLFLSIGLFLCFKKRHQVSLSKDAFGSHQGLAKRVINMHENILYSSFKGDFQVIPQSLVNNFKHGLGISNQKDQMLKRPGV